MVMAGSVEVLVKPLLLEEHPREVPWDPAVVKGVLLSIP